MLVRRREEEEKRTGEELGARLLESLRGEVVARMEAQLQDEVRARAKNDEHLWYNEFTAVEKAKMVTQLQEELEPVVKAQLTLAKLEEVRHELRLELASEVMETLKDELTPTLKEEVRNQLKQDLEQEVIERLRQDNHEGVIETLRDENFNSVRDDLRAELYPQISDELRQGESKRAAEEPLATEKTLPFHMEETNKHDLTVMVNGARDQDALNGDMHNTQSNTDELYPDIEDMTQSTGESMRTSETLLKIERTTQDGIAPSEQATTHAIENGYRDVLLNSDVEPDLQPLDNTPAQDRDQTTKSGARNDVVDPALSPENDPSAPDGDDEASIGAYETAPQRSRDFRFDPEKHSISFSSPLGSEVGRKRSRSASEIEDEDVKNPFKRLRSDQPTNVDGANLGRDLYSSQEESELDEDGEGYEAESSAEDGSLEENYDETASVDEAVDYIDDEGNLEDPDTVVYGRQQKQVRNIHAYGDNDSVEYEEDSEEEDYISENEAFGTALSKPSQGFSNTQDTAITLDDSDDEAEGVDMNVEEAGLTATSEAT